MRRRRIVLSFLAFSAVGLAGQGVPDISGAWVAEHPDPDRGRVLLEFRPLPGTDRLGDRSRTEYAVSLWSDSGPEPRPLRDGAFGSFTRASLVPGEHGWEILWADPGSRARRTNPVRSFSPRSELVLGPEAGGDPGAEARLAYRSDCRPPPPDLPPYPGLRGVYELDHPAAGRILLSLEPSSPGEYAVRALREYPGLGYAVRHEGLFGGTEGDLPWSRVRMERDAGAPVLVWSGTGPRGGERRTRILAENGGFALCGLRGSDRFAVDAFLAFRAGPEARIDRPSAFLSLGGLYRIEGPGLPGPATVLVRDSGLRAGGRILFSVETVRETEDSPVRIRSGILPGDTFGHAAVVEREGRCLLRFYSLSSQRTEELEVRDIEPDGGFSLAGGYDPAAEPVLRARRLLRPGPPLLGLPAAGPSGPATPGPAESGPEDPEGRIRDLETLGPLRFDRDPSAGWTTRELDILRDTLRAVPPELLRQEEIRVRRGDGEYRRIGDVLLTRSPRGRELVLSAWNPLPGTYPAGEEAAAQRLYLGRLAVHYLARLYYEGLPRAVRREWESFSLWRPAFPGDARAENREEDGYADPIGLVSPAHDFASFAEACILPPPYKDPWSDPRVRLPDKTRFLAGLFPGLGPGAVPAGSPVFRGWIDPSRVEKIELVVTTPTASSIASIAGHVLLLVRLRGDPPDGRNSRVFGFVGDVSRDAAAGIGGVSYAFRGITGRYGTMVEEETLDRVVRRALLAENRDVLRFEIVLSEEERERFLERLWILSRSVSYRYRFFTVNCASMLLDALNQAVPEGSEVEVRALFAAPMLIVSRLAEAGRIGDFSYPEYWNLGREARRAFDENRGLERRILRDLPPGPREEARAAFRVLRAEGAGTLYPDPLFREPRLVRGSPERGAAYEDLSRLLAQARPGTKLEREEDLGLLGIRYLDNAFDIELFRAAPRKPDTRRIPAGLYPGRTPREALERELYRVRSRQENSPEIEALRRASSSLKLRIDALQPGLDVYSLPRRMEEARWEALERERRRVSFSHGYFPRTLEAGVGSSGDRIYPAAAYSSALFRGQLGDTGVCTLKPDMRLELLSFRALAGLGPSPYASDPAPGEAFLRTEGTLFRVDKILVPDTVRYSGLPNPGFGISLLESSALAWDGRDFFPGSEDRTRIAEARLILNLFESGGFRTYLNAAAGAGYVREVSNGAVSDYLGLPLSAEGKLPFGSNSDSCLRFRAEWLPLLDRGVLTESRAACEARLSLGPPRRTNRVLSASISVDLDLRYPGGGAEIEARRALVLVGMKW